MSAASRPAISRPGRRWVRWAWLMAGLLLAACALAPAAPPPTPTSTPTHTPAPSPTPTVVWFPPTATFTPFPTRAVTPTPDQLTGVGPLLLRDEFQDPSVWDLKTTPEGAVSLAGGELSLVLTEPGGFLFSTRREPLLTDFYVEITARTSLCQGLDEFGLMLRVSPNLDYYRFSLSCDGQARLDRIYRGGAASLQPWTFGGGVPLGAPGEVRLGAWVVGEELRLFIADQLLFSVRDPLIPTGTLGVFARSAGETAITVSFADLAIYQAQAQP